MIKDKLVLKGKIKLDDLTLTNRFSGVYTASSGLFDTAYNYGKRSVIDILDDLLKNRSVEITRMILPKEGIVTWGAGED